MRCRWSNKAFAVLLLGLSLCAASLVAAETEREARAVYRAVCGYCHDTELGPQLHGRQLPVDYTTHVVRNGLRAMPAFRSTEISDTELQLLASMIAHSEGGQ